MSAKLTFTSTRQETPLSCFSASMGVKTPVKQRFDYMHFPHQNIGFWLLKIDFFYL